MKNKLVNESLTEFILNNNLDNENLDEGLKDNIKKSVLGASIIFALNTGVVSGQIFKGEKLKNKTENVFKFSKKIIKNVAEPFKDIKDSGEDNIEKISNNLGKLINNVTNKLKPKEKGSTQFDDTNTHISESEKTKFIKYIITKYNITDTTKIFIGIGISSDLYFAKDLASTNAFNAYSKVRDKYVNDETIHKSKKEKNNKITKISSKDKYGIKNNPEGYKIERTTLDKDKYGDYESIFVIILPN